MSCDGVEVTFQSHAIEIGPQTQVLQVTSTRPPIEIIHGECTIQLQRESRHVDISSNPHQVTVEHESRQICIGGITPVTGENNTAVNIGGGPGEVFSAKTGVTLELRTIIGAGDTTVSTVGDTIEVSSTNTPLSIALPTDVDTTAASAGIGIDAARSDHRHHALTATAASIGAGNAEGVSTSLARADHGHALVETSGPTDLTIGAIADGDLLRRSGTAIIGLDSGTYGDVFGPASSIDNDLALFDGTTGKLIKGGSGWTSSGDDLVGSGVVMGAGFEFLPQSSTPGVAANTLYQDDGSNYNANTLVWTSESLFIGSFNVGDPGFEQSSININGQTIAAIAKVSDIGGTKHSQLVLHRHSTLRPVTMTTAYTPSNSQSHTPVTAGHVLFELSVTGRDANNYKPASIIEFDVDPAGTVSTSSMPGRISFLTSQDGSNNPSLSLRILSNHGLEVYGNLSMQGGNINDVTLVDGVDVSNHAARHLQGGADSFAADLLSSGTATADYVLTSDGAGGNQYVDIATLTPSGDVIGPGSSLDNEVVLFSGTTGKLIKSGSSWFGGSGNLTGAGIVVGGGYQFTPQSLNPGVVANTLYQDDGTNYNADSLIWTSESVFLDPFTVGDPGFEQSSINVEGQTIEAICKINDIGGTKHSQLVLHRHSTLRPATMTVSRANSNTSSHAAVTPGQIIFDLTAVGRASNNYKEAATLEIDVDPAGTVSNTSMPGRWNFYTSADGSTNPSLAMTIRSDQGVDVHGDLSLDGNNITDVNLVDGVDVSNHAARHSDGGADEINAADLGSGAATSGQVLTADGAGGNSYTTVVTTDELIGVTAADTTPGYLSPKISAAIGLSQAVLNPAANEQLELNVTGFQESGGPTEVTYGAIADGQYMVRSGTTIVGVNGFVPFYEYLADDSDTSTTSATYVNKFSTTSSSLPAGDYLVTWSAEFSHGSASSGSMQVLVAGTVIGTGDIGLIQVNAYLDFAGHTVLTSISGTKTVQFQYLSSGVASVSMRRARLTFLRVA